MIQPSNICKKSDELLFICIYFKGRFYEKQNIALYPGLSVLTLLAMTLAACGGKTDKIRHLQTKGDKQGDYRVHK